MSGTDVSTMVPGRYDVVIDGYGYKFWDALLTSLPFRYQRAVYTYSPTFLERTNVGAGYGDDAQAFWLTASQNDWSEGEMRRYFRSDDTPRRYWTGMNVDPISAPGQVGIRRTTPTLTFGGAVQALCETPAGIYAAGTTNLYLVDATGAVTDKGAHGLGVAPAKWGIASDGINVFLSSTAGGTNGIRKWDGSSYTTFSATGADSLAFLNNVLYGYQESTGRLIEYSTTGIATTLFTWQDAAGNALTGSNYSTRLRPYGGQLLILRKLGSRRNGELWQFNDSDVEELGDFPANFSAQDIEVVSGIVFIAGYVNRNADVLPAIFYYVNGQVGQLWIANVSGYTNLTWPAMAGYGEGIVFTDDTTGKLMQYNLAVGGVHTIGGYTVTNATPMMAANKSIVVHTRNSTTGYYYPSTTVASSAVVITSLFDFDNSLVKLPRGIKAEFASAADGDGGSVDVAYQIDSVDGSFTSLKTGATTGVEYTLPALNGNSISVKVTLNKGSSTYGPILKRIYVRAAPLLTTYRQRQYVLDLSGVHDKPDTRVKLRDDSDHPLTGLEQAANLLASIASQTPLTITDRFGSFTGILEPGENSTELDEVRPGEFIAQLKVREV